MNEGADLSSKTILRVSPEACPCRVDSYLAAEVDSLSRTRLKGLIRDGLVRVDGKPVKPRHTLHGHEEILINLPPPADSSPLPEAIDLDILYEDSDLLAIDKPAGMVVHPGAGISSGTLVNALLHHCPDLSGIGGVARPGIVHRLDRRTSGCLVVAKNDAAHQGLSAQLADRTMGRVYLAWVNGVVPDREGRIDAPLGRSPRNRTRMAVVSRGGRPAATNWKVLARAPGLTRLECRLETGRTHQVRVHLAHLGHPVVGDTEYGLSPKEARRLVPPGYPKIIQALSRCRRQLLHARGIHFTHPRTGKPLEFEAPLPEDFETFDSVLEPFTTD